MKLREWAERVLRKPPFLARVSLPSPLPGPVESPIQIKIERAPTTKGNGMSTTGGENLIIQGRVTGKVIKLSHFLKNGCKWTGFICLNGLRPKLWLLQPKEGRRPIQTERSTSPHLRRSSRSWAPNYASLLLFHVSKSGLIPYLIRPLLVFELVINGRLN